MFGKTTAKRLWYDTCEHTQNILDVAVQPSIIHLDVLTVKIHRVLPIAKHLQTVTNGGQWKSFWEFSSQSKPGHGKLISEDFTDSISKTEQNQRHNENNFWACFTMRKNCFKKVSLFKCVPCTRARSICAQTQAIYDYFTNSVVLARQSKITITIHTYSALVQWRAPVLGGRCDCCTAYRLPTSR